MINLMPPTAKESILFARRNTVLIKWMTFIGFAAAGVVIIAAAGLFYLKQDTAAYRTSIDVTKAELAAQNEADTLKRVEEISGNLKLVVDVLSNEVQFSRLLQQIGLVMPNGTILQDLSLSSDLDGGINLIIGASSYERATQAQVNLSDASNRIFDKADIVSLTCSDANPRDPRYPCTAEMRALFIKDNNPFLLLNQDGDS